MVTASSMNDTGDRGLCRVPAWALMIGIASNPDRSGHWTEAQEAGVFAFGGAPFLGSMGNRLLGGGIFGVAASG